MIDKLFASKLKRRMIARYECLDKLEQRVNDLNTRLQNLRKDTPRTATFEDIKSELRKEIAQEEQNMRYMEEAYEIELIFIYTETIEILKYDEDIAMLIALRADDDPTDPIGRESRAFQLQNMVRFPKGLEATYGTLATFIRARQKYLLQKHGYRFNDKREIGEEVYELFGSVELVDSIKGTLPHNDDKKKRRALRETLNLILPREDKDENAEAIEER